MAVTSSRIPIPGPNPVNETTNEKMKAIASLSSHLYSLNDLSSAIGKLEQRQVTGKVVVRV